jgi:hypothetical protein
MACCLALAFLFAVVRKLSPGSREDVAFAPPAFRAGPGAVAETLPAPNRARHRAPSTHPTAGSHAPLRLGLWGGALAYLVDVLLLTGSGVLRADLVVHGILAAVAATAALRTWRSADPRALADTAAVMVGVAGLTFGTLGLFEMHVVQTTDFVSPSLLADLAFHGAGPAVAAGAAILLSIRPARRLGATR